MNTLHDYKTINKDFIENFAVSAASTENPAINITQKILTEIMQFHRAHKGKQCTNRFHCPKCLASHLPKILAAVHQNQPIQFVLPAFPGKSPNPEKVLGPLPDFAEQLALSFLGTICTRIKAFYRPGIKITLCSDGRVFSDVVGIEESNVTAYQMELDKLIHTMSLSDISTFNLDDCYKQLDFTQMREQLMNNYAQSIDELKYKTLNGSKSSATPEEIEANSLYRGITRFLVEDSMHAGQTKSRTAIQKESRLKAYEVIRRSNAWSNLIADRFPKAVRLSIHPQACGSKKLGIRLIANESWMTPWHGVAVQFKDGHVLLKRSEAEALGAQLIYASNGRLSHYQLSQKQSVLKGA